MLSGNVYEAVSYRDQRLQAYLLCVGYQEGGALNNGLMFLLVFISFRLHNIVVFPFDHAPLFWKVTAYQISNFRSFKYDLMINTCLCH